MDSAWLIAAAGIATAAAGLYLLTAVPRARWDVLTQVGAALVFLGAAVSASRVLRPTGSFAGLLAFSLISAGAVAGLVMLLVARRTDSGWLAFGATALCVSGVMLFRGAAAGVLAVAVCGLAAMLLGFRHRRKHGGDPAPESSANLVTHFEPLLACIAWGILVWGLLRSLALPAASPASALLNNHLAVGSVIFAGGLLSLFLHHTRGRAVLGLATATLGLVLLLSACSVTDETGAGAAFAAIVVATGAVQVAGMVWVAARTRRFHAAGRLSAEQGGPAP